MHEISTHVINIQISENTIITYSNDIKITWNQVTISLCALGSTSRLAQQSETLPMMPSQHKTHPHWPRPRQSERSTLHGSYSEMKVISWVFLRFEFRSREYLSHALDCSLRLLGEIAVLLGVYKLRILAVGDCLTDVSTILVFVCKNRVILAEFQHIDGSVRWLTSFNCNHTPHAGTLPSTGHC